MKTVYYYLYDKKKRPVVTICIIEENYVMQKRHFRGVAICAEQDIKLGNFSKKRGRQIAFGRAKKAFNTQRDCCPIGSKRASDILKDVDRRDNMSIRGAVNRIFSFGKAHPVEGSGYSGLTPTEVEMLAVEDIKRGKPRKALPGKGNEEIGSEKDYDFEDGPFRDSDTFNVVQI